MEKISLHPAPLIRRSVLSLSGAPCQHGQTAHGSWRGVGQLQQHSRSTGSTTSLYGAKQKDHPLATMREWATPGGRGFARPETSPEPKGPVV